MRYYDALNSKILFKYLYIVHPVLQSKVAGSFDVSGKLPTYPSPKPILTLASHLGQNVAFNKMYLCLK